MKIRYALAPIVVILALLSISAPTHATVAPTELTVVLAQGSTTIRTIAFSNPENTPVTVTAQAIGVSDDVIILNSPQNVTANGSTTFTLFIQANKEQSGFITLAYSGKLEYIPVTITFSENAGAGGSGYLAVTYDLYVNVGASTKMIVRDASTSAAVIDARVVITAPTPMTLSAVSGVADVPIEENGIYTGKVQASGYRDFYFVMVAKGTATPQQTVAGISTSPAPLIQGQMGQITATSSTGAAVQGVKLYVNGIEYSNPAIVVPTGLLITVEVKDAQGNSVYGPSYISVSSSQPTPTPPEGETNYRGIAIFVVAIVIVGLLLYFKPYKKGGPP